MIADQDNPPARPESAAPSSGTPRGTVSVMALGCRANQEEMECLLSRLGEAGYEVVPFGQPADWVVVNTCTVTSAGDSDSRQMVRRGTRLKGNGRLIVTGCLAQRDPAALAAIPGVDWVVGNAEKPALFGWMENENAPAVAPADCPPVRVQVAADPTLGRFAEYGVSREGRRGRATLKVQDGCDEHCTYCIIPQVRGHSRSRDLADTLAQARRLALSGYREVVLTGINTALWGADLPSRPDLPSLVEALGTVAGLERVRISSLEPQYVTAGWLERLEACPAFCRHFHLPLQSGDAQILRRMGRRYGPELYAELAGLIHRRMPDAAVGSDILVGFPGETEEAFENTVRLVSALPLAYLHVFSYSPRPGTPAPRLGGSVDEGVRRERSARLRRLDREIRRRFAVTQLGTVQTVVPESPCGGDLWQGTTGNYLRIRFPWSGPRSPESLPLVLLESWDPSGWVRGRVLGASIPAKSHRKGAGA